MRRSSEASTDPESAVGSTTSSPTLSRANTEPSHPGRRGSRMGNILTSIRQSLAAEQELLFHNHTNNRQAYDLSSVSDHHDSLGGTQERARQESPVWESDQDSISTISPAVQARRLSEANENNMGPHSHETPTTWGWPGLGTWPEQHHTRPKLGRLSSKERTLVEPRLEAATLEAIDNAAESESFGWPGLGLWPGKK